MKTFTEHQLARYSNLLQTAYTERNPEALKQHLDAVSKLEIPEHAALGWCLIKALTMARYQFLIGEFEPSHINTLEGFVNKSDLPREWFIYLYEDLVTFQLHYGNLQSALHYLECIAHFYLEDGIISMALEAQLKRLHLKFVFEAGLHKNELHLIQEFERLFLTARKSRCKSVESSCALFISKEYVRLNRLQDALTWADRVIDSFLGLEVEHGLHLEIAFLHRSQIYQSMGLTAASLMDIEASKWALR